MVELVDAQSSEGCIRKGVWVQVPLSAPDDLANVMSLVSWGVLAEDHQYPA